MLVQCNRLYRKLPFSISRYRSQIQKPMIYRSSYQIIKNPVSNIFFLFDKFYLIISTTIVPKPYIELFISKIPKPWYWKSRFRNSSHRNIDIENIENIKNIKFCIKPEVLSMVDITWLLHSVVSVSFEAEDMIKNAWHLRVGVLFVWN